MVSCVLYDRGPNEAGEAFGRTRYNSGERHGGGGSVPWRWRGMANVFENVDVWKCAANGWWSAVRSVPLSACA